MTKIEILLEPADLKILDSFRGNLSRDVFVKTILRMLQSEAVSPLPEWVREAECSRKPRPTQISNDSV